jgi:hypothetical protein|tara:strand:- start:1088 stop:1273 length:186 start_codon:yes stop_codon:yes gene_type:complete
MTLGKISKRNNEKTNSTIMEIEEILLVGILIILFGYRIRIVVNNIRNGRKWGEGLPDDLGE